MADPGEDLGLPSHVCLALVVEGIEHGWALGTVLAPDGDLGRIWTLSRSLTYRAVDQLVEGRLLVRRGTSEGRGRDRSLLRPTAAGRRVTAAWLDRPVEHLREVRTELLVKLALRQRAGLPTKPLLRAQRTHVEAVIVALTAAAEDGDLVDRWRGESARAVRRFLDGELDADRRSSARRRPAALRLSARNQISATVDSIAHGDILSAVRTRLPDGQRLTAVITNDALGELDVADGDPVLVIVKSTETMLGKG